jgi:hypothetical protein
MSDIVDVPSYAKSQDNDDIAVDDTIGGVVLLEARQYRKSALIINTGAGAMRITTDGTAPSNSHGKYVAVGGALALSSPNCPTAVIRAIAQDTTDTSANASEVF